MSRLGKQIITIPTGVSISRSDATITVKGKKGELSREFKDNIVITITDTEVSLVPKSMTDLFSKSLWGTYASHMHNMITGVTEVYEKKLSVEGVGYKWALAGKNIEMQLGFSHPVVVPVPEGLEVSTEKNDMIIRGIDKELVGSFAAKIRAYKKPEPYKGKGIRYQGETVRRKQGKRSA